MTHPSPVEESEGTLTVPFNPCLKKLSKDEPFFVLLGRDEQAAMAVEAWADFREAAEGASDWTRQARAVAHSMRAYRIARNAGLAPTESALSPSPISERDAALEAAVKIVLEPAPDIERHRFVVDGKIVKDAKGRDIFVAHADVEQLLRDKIAAIRALKSSPAAPPTDREKVMKASDNILYKSPPEAARLREWVAQVDRIKMLEAALPKDLDDGSLDFIDANVIAMESGEFWKSLRCRIITALSSPANPKDQKR